jgi:hypothetical protein
VVLRPYGFFGRPDVERSRRFPESYAVDVRIAALVGIEHRAGSGSRDGAVRPGSSTRIAAGDLDGKPARG